ncbi:prepilin-type N-terminal cleavage/methylation domain-containing protein [Chloroflexota bacterium]
MRQFWQVRFRPFRRQWGFTLVEVLLAVAIFAAIGVTFISAIGTGYRSVRILDEKTQAEALIRSQLDDIKASPYQDSGNYTVTVNLPPTYSMSIKVTAPMSIGTADNYTSLEELMGGPVTTIQEITVSVFRPGNGEDRPVLSIATYKVKE